MPAAKGTRPPNAGKGRPKGSQNKVTTAFKEAVLEAFHQIGGTSALVSWGMQNQTEFYKIAARLIPTEVNAAVAGKDGGPVAVTFTVIQDAGRTAS